MSPRLNDLLEGLLQPTWEDRLTASQAKAVLAGQAGASQQQQRRQQEQKAWNPFSQDGWEDTRQRSRASSSDRQVSLSCSCVQNVPVGLPSAVASSTACYCVGMQQQYCILFTGMIGPCHILVACSDQTIATESELSLSEALFGCRQAMTSKRQLPHLAGNQNDRAWASTMYCLRWQQPMSFQAPCSRL